MASEGSATEQGTGATSSGARGILVAFPLLVLASWCALRGLHTLGEVGGRLPSPFAPAQRSPASSPAVWAGTVVPETLAWIALAFAVALALAAIGLGSARGDRRALVWLAASLLVAGTFAGTLVLIPLGYGADWVAIALSTVALLIVALPGSRGHYLCDNHPAT